jgi:ferredoxin
VQVEKPTSERVTTATGDFMRKYKRAGSITLMMSSTVKEIGEGDVTIVDSSKREVKLANDAVFTMLGREAPLDFFRRSGVGVHGDRTATWWVTLILFLVFCIWMYHWKKSGVHVTGVQSIDQKIDVGTWWEKREWFPYNVPSALSKLGAAWNRPSNLLGVLKTSLGQPGFYYSFAYCACVVGFGIARIRRRRTPYVKWQTTTLMLVQCIPLFLLPYIVLPWMGYNGWFAHGTHMGKIADQLFESYDSMGYNRAYWRSFGFVLAWPLFFYNVFTDQPMWTWLAISIVQTFVIIPAIVYYWGKGAYCGWICSCGALAETVGDRHREKMPHGPFWNRFNMVGQVFLAFALVLLGLRVIGWASPNSFAGRWYHALLETIPVVNYKWFVDLLWAGILGVGMYFWFSGRVWCRFACPLAALMHIYARFSRFRILADKKKCISCNVCTSVCHQGIDVMNFANKGLPMQDPECVRCSACVQSCPTGVLSFGQVDRKTGKVIRLDRLGASPVQRVELRHNGKVLA